MRHRLLAAMFLAAAVPLSAQTSDAPNLVFSISFGLTTGKDLWTVPRQPLIAPGNAQDTVSLGRRLRPGLTGAVSATLYASPNLGYTAEIGYYGLSSEQRCSGPAAWAADSNSINEQGCTRAQGTHLATSIVGFQVGALYRVAPNGKFQPFVRGTVGLGLLGNSFVQTSGAVVVSPGCSPQPCDYRLLDGEKSTDFTWLAQAAAGLTINLAPAYRLRMEVRDIITSVPVATGPAPVGSLTAFAPTSRRVVHVPTFMIGLDLVFERRHTRRY